MSWDTKNGQFGKSSKRKTFTDDAIAHSKVIPAPNVYNTDRKFYKVPLGKARYLTISLNNFTAVQRALIF